MQLRSRFSLVVLCLFLGISSLTAAAELPAGVTALIVDLKYSKARGVQICEVQTVSRSRFAGSDFAHEADGYVGEQLVPILTQGFERVWYGSRSIVDPGVRSALQSAGAIPVTDLSKLEARADFRAVAKAPVADPSDLASYRGLVYMRGSKDHSLESLRKRYPGVIWVDVDVWRLTESKSEMNALFRGDQVLKNFKPRCQHFKTKYKKQLAKDIQNQVGEGLVVIKPLNAVKGRGVLILPAKDLDKTLKRILKKSVDLRRDPDPNIRYWYVCNDAHFVVEEFAESDPVRVDHLKKRSYDGTMRAVVVVTQDRGETRLDLADCYWKLPSKALSQSGTRTELHKSCGAIPYFAEVDAQIEAEVESELSEALPQMYQLLTAVAAS